MVLIMKARGPEYFYKFKQLPKWRAHLIHAKPLFRHLADLADSGHPQFTVDTLKTFAFEYIDWRSSDLCSLTSYDDGTSRPVFVGLLIEGLKYDVEGV